MFRISLVVLLSGCAHVSLSSLASEPWVEAETEHIRVRTTLSAQTAQDLATRIERERRELLLMWGTEFNPTEKMNVLVLQTAQAEEVLRNRYSGFFSTIDADGQLLLSSSGAFGDGTTAEVRLHEMTHALIASAIRHHLPRWLNEGIAEYLSSLKYLEVGQVEFGRARVDRLQVLRRHTRIESPRLRAWAEDTGLSTLDLSLHYATAWGWVLYLVNTQPDAFNQYLAALASGSGEEAAWSKAFGTQSIESMDRDFGIFLQQGVTAVTTVPMPPVNAQVTSRTMTEAERHAVIGRLMASRLEPSDFEAAKVEVELALKLDPKQPEALRLLKSIQLREGTKQQRAVGSGQNQVTKMVDAHCADLPDTEPLEVGPPSVRAWYSEGQLPMPTDEIVKSLKVQLDGKALTLVVGPPAALADVKPPTAVLLRESAGGSCVVNTWATMIGTAVVKDAKSAFDPKSKRAVFLIKLEVSPQVGAPVQTHWALLATDGTRLWSPMPGHPIIREGTLVLGPEGIRAEFRDRAPTPLVFLFDGEQFAQQKK